MAKVLNAQDYLFKKIYKLLDKMDSVLDRMIEDVEPVKEEKNSVMKSKGKLVRFPHRKAGDI